MRSSHGWLSRWGSERTAGCYALAHVHLDWQAFHVAKDGTVSAGVSTNDGRAVLSVFDDKDVIAALLPVVPSDHPEYVDPPIGS